MSRTETRPATIAWRERLAHGLDAPMLLTRKWALLATYASSMTSLLVGSVAQLVTFAILARGLGVSQFGLLMGVTAACNLAVQICGFGATETMVRRVAQDPGIYPVALGHNLILTGLSGLVLVLGFTAVMPFFYELSANFAVNVLLMLVMAVSNVVVFRWILLTEQIFIAHGQIRNANYANVGFALGRTAIAGVACFGFGVRDVAGYAVWQGVGHLFIAAVCTWALRPLGGPSWRIMRDEVRLGLFFSTPYIFQALRQNVDFVVLGIITTPGVLGTYAMARRIVDTSGLTITALYRLSYPVLARATPGGLWSALPLILGILVTGLGLAVATATGVSLVAPVMPWLFGKGFGDMIPYVRIMCWVMIPVTVQSVATETLGAAARHGLRASLFNAGTLFGAAITAILTKIFLLPGSFAALYLSESLLAVAFWAVLIPLIRRDRERRTEGPAASFSSARKGVPDSADKATR